MTKEMQAKDNPTLNLPKHLFLFSAAVGLFTPFLARLPSVPIRGWEWFTDYFPGLTGLLFFSAFNLIPSGAWYAFGKGSKKSPLVFWFSVAGGVAFLLWSHGSLNLSSSSTAGIVLIFLPFYSVAAILVGWIIGLCVNAAINDEKWRIVTAWCVCGLAVVVGAGYAFQDSRTIVARESRFPYTAVSNIPLQNSIVYGSESKVRAEVISFGNFDSLQGNELVVLCRSNITTLQPGSYEIKSKTEYNQEDCDGCVSMYPYLVPDGKGSILVSTSDGVSDKNGKLLWAWEAEGFSRVVPISHTPSPKFLSYQNTDYIVLHDAVGNELWRKNIPVSDIGRYTTTEGEQLPFAITGYSQESRLTIYTQEGEQKQIIKLPEWASEVSEIAWPSRGHLLVGAGSWIGILSPGGDILLQHVIQDTSFNPYHGPEGTPVKFYPSEEPYLAVLSHGSSGYARSVLLIFDPEGNLVWQEERKKLTTIIAAPAEDGSSEVLLVGGIEGIVEYKISKPKTLNN